MARRWLVAGMVAAAMMVLAAEPSMAKGEHQGPPHPWRCPVGGDPYCPEGRVTIVGSGQGGGGGGPVSIAARDFWRVLYLTSPPFRPYGYAEPSVPARSQLGPQFRATYVIHLENGRTRTMLQELYPYAAGGVWAFTPAGQKFQGGLTGWWRSTALLDILVAHGLPAAAPIAATSSDADPAGAAAGGGVGPRPWVAVAALAALLFLVAAVEQRRRGPIPNA